MTSAILLHGGGLGPWSWRRVAELLPFDCHAPALPGHRGSPVPLFDMRRAVDEVIALAESLGEPVVLAGLSLGGQLAVDAAAARPDLVRCVVGSGVNLGGIPMVGAVTSSLRLLKGLTKSGPLIRLTARSMGVTGNDVEEMLADGKAMDPNRLAAVYLASSAVRLPTDLPADKTLILAGSKEAKVIRRSLDTFAAAGVSTDVIPGGRHTWPLSAPEQFAARVVDWHAHTTTRTST
jgi:pimeloyl-ACP methyl ester carboxylesterase